MTNKRKVLVLDASKVVRASLIKQLSDRFEVRDEQNDESGCLSASATASCRA